MTKPVTFTVPGNPIPKARARVTIRPGRKPTAYTPRRTKNWEATVKDAARLAMGGRELFEGPVAVELWLWRGDRRKADADNMEKAVLDACNEVVWLDDDQVLEMHRYKIIGWDEPHIAVRIWPIRRQPLIARGLAWAAKWLGGM
jgi:Holliday junction resolvase RusA-like endonuclease